MADKNENALDKLKGKAKEVTGKATGDRRKETEGKTDQVKADTKKKADDLGDRVEGAVDSLRRDDKD